MRPLEQSTFSREANRDYRVATFQVALQKVLNKFGRQASNFTIAILLATAFR